MINGSELDWQRRGGQCICLSREMCVCIVLLITDCPINIGWPIYSCVYLYLKLG